ncbi:MAG: hypothetical protein VX069_01935 [Cyanobacteriota bacterium]|nr:hypothetical protein [Cyanobacteriota bacterium]MED5384965.1 hypothetical protein [Cyanobacteriota bacterium]
MKRHGNQVRRPLKWLHGVSHLVQQGHCQKQGLKSDSGVASRRWAQRRKTGSRLLEMEPEGWDRPDAKGARFWRMLRWGGAGFVLAWWLSRL